MMIELGTLYLNSFHFDGEKCAVLLSNKDGRSELVTFGFVRSFVFFKESDFYKEIGQYDRVRLMRADNLPSTAFRIIKNPMADKLLAGRLDNEAPMHFGVWTPDECFEIVSFEEPAITVPRPTYP